MLRPFVYRRYLDFSAIEALRTMKQLIQQEVRRKGMADNIKLGAGGIREVEFIAQAFQLIHGGRDLSLQQRPLLKVLSILEGQGHWPNRRQRRRQWPLLLLHQFHGQLRAGLPAGRSGFGGSTHLRA